MRAAREEDRTDRCDHGVDGDLGSFEYDVTELGSWSTSGAPVQIIATYQ